MEPAVQPADRTRLRVRLALAGLVLAGVVWAFALWWSVTHRESPETLPEPARLEAEAACDDALPRLQTLPNLDERSDALDAVALTRAENEVFRELVDRLGAVDASGEPAEAYARWLGDWEAVIDARATYVDGLERTGSGRFAVPLDTILRMQEYADGRDLEECAPDTMQLDVVDSPRVYPEEG